MALFPARNKYSDLIAMLLPDGRIEVDSAPVWAAGLLRDANFRDM